MSAPADPAAWLAASAERVIETSCAWVFLTGGTALKLKKPVDYRFLDFSTPAKRRWAIERELRFNRATAPDIYRRVRRLTRAADGAYGLDGEGETLDFLLEMRAFDPEAVLAEHPERLDPALGEALGRTIARFHARAEPRPEGGGVWALGYTIRTNAEHLRGLASELGPERVERVIAATDAALGAAAPLLEARRRQGFARRCHGDLHLGNILIEAGRPVLFDCIEFNDRLSDIDVLYDVAFLVMDLSFRRRADAANRALGGWLDEAARAFPPTLWDGLAALPLMLSARASVRAHVTGALRQTDRARAYLTAAERHLSPAPVRLVALGGLAGTGKSTLARRIAPVLGAPPGAVVLRSDEIRKRLAGKPPTARLPEAEYAAAADDRVYAEMMEIAGRALGAGRSVVLDASFLEPARRRAAEALARRAGAHLAGYWLGGDPALLRRRLEARTGDASDAGAAVLARQLERDPGAIAWARIDAADPSALLRLFDKTEAEDA